MEINIYHENLSIRQTISNGIKSTEVLRKNGEGWTILSPYDDDHKKGIIALHNHKVKHGLK